MLMDCSFGSEERFLIVMELMTCSLRSLIDSQILGSRSSEKKENHKSTPIVLFAPSEALNVISKITLDMVYLHSKGVSYRNLKTTNVLVQDFGHDYMQIKLVDFGASVNIDSSGMRIGVGTGFWRAPKVLPTKTTDKHSKPDLKAANVYSLAMTFYEVLTGKVPFHDKLSIGQLKCNDYEKVIKGLRPKLPSNLDGRLTELIKMRWQNHPKSRPNMEYILMQLLFMKPNTDSSGRPLSQQVSKALETIENVQKISSRVWVNKHQCKLVADCFAAIGKRLLELNYCGDSDASNKIDNPAFDMLLTVLQKGKVLVSKNIQWARIKSVLTWIDNREAFKEIHEELDTMSLMFPFEGFSGHFETRTGIQRSVILAQDVDKDLEAMKDMSQFLQAIEKPQAMDLEKVLKVVSEKSKVPKGNLIEESDNLPSYLKIDLSTIDIKDPVQKQEILSDQESKDTHGWAVVCEGRWLGCECAVKVFNSNWNKDQLLKEVGALMKLRHPRITRFIGFAEDAVLCSLLMEDMHEDLQNFINLCPKCPFTSSQELDIRTQIAKGMLYLHTQGHVHGDLKCSNLLVKKYEDYIEIKIPGIPFFQTFQSVRDLSEKNLAKRTGWAPLEALDNYGGAKSSDDLLKQADVYSFTMTCYEVVSRKYPFDSVLNGDWLSVQIIAGVRPQLPRDLDNRVQRLIEACWDNDPNKPPMFENICVVLYYIRSSICQWLHTCLLE